MSTATANPAHAVGQNPFRFLRAYTRDEMDVFKGRSEEIAILYEKVRNNRITLVYGESGVGKTSLVQCGLANKFQPSDWYDVLVLRKDNINQSLIDTLSQLVPTEGESTPTRLLKDLYVENFKPLYLIFDQLEELYVNGSDQEIAAFYDTIDEIIHTLNTFCRIIFIIREDFHSRLDGFEKRVVPLFQAGFRVNRLKEEEALCSVQMTLLKNQRFVAVSPGLEAVSRLIVEKCTVDGMVNSSQLQILLFMLWRKAPKPTAGVADISEALVRGVAKSSEELLKEYVGECLEEIAGLRSAEVVNLLQKFIAADGTKRSVDVFRLDEDLTDEQLGWLTALVERQILKQLEDTRYDLMHDSLIPIIKSTQSKPPRPRLVNPPIKGNPYKGLTAYNEEDEAFFFGRSWVITEFNVALRKGRLLVIVGPSGSGKSSLIKAGLLPPLVKEGYNVITCRPGRQPAKGIGQITDKLAAHAGQKAVVYIDQFEELNTQSESEKESKDFIDFLNQLLLVGPDQDKKLKIILSVRADYESAFDKSFPNWRASKRTIPPFSEEDYRQIITEPAYLAGLEFRPHYLVENIVRDVMQSHGALPLLSYALNQVYEKYREKGAADGFLTEEYYNEIGGVWEGLPRQANAIYSTADAATQNTIRKVMLRMVSMGIGEKAAKRVYLKDLDYEQPGENERVAKVLQLFGEKWLVVTGIDEQRQVYYEPAHDSLVREWPLIDQWIKKYGRELLYLQESLTEAITEFKNFDKLWNDDPRLDELEKILASPENWLNREEAAFVRESKEKQVRIQEEESRQETERKMLEDRKRSLTRQVGMISTFALFSLLAMAIALIFYVKARKANEDLKRNTETINRQAITLDSTARAYRDARDTSLARSVENYELFQDAKKAKDSLEVALKKYREADSLRKTADVRAFSAAQKQVQTVNLLSQIKSLENTLPALTWQLGMRLQNRDSSNRDLDRFLAEMNRRDGFFESVIIDSTRSSTFSTAGGLFSTISTGNLIRIWDLRGNLVGKYSEDGFNPSVLFSPDDKTILTTVEKSLTLRTITGRELARWDNQARILKTVIARNSLNSWYIIAIDINGFTILDQNAKPIETISGEFTHVVEAVADSNLLVIRTSDKISTYNLPSGVLKSSASISDGFLLPGAGGILVFRQGIVRILDYDGKPRPEEIYRPNLSDDYRRIESINYSRFGNDIAIRFVGDGSVPASARTVTYILDRRSRYFDQDIYFDLATPGALLFPGGGYMALLKKNSFTVTPLYVSMPDVSSGKIEWPTGTIAAVHFSPRTERQFLVTTTTGGNGKTTLWQWGTIAGLDAKGLLKRYPPKQLDDIINSLINVQFR